MVWNEKKKLLFLAVPWSPLIIISVCHSFVKFHFMQIIDVIIFSVVKLFKMIYLQVYVLPTVV